MFRSIPVANKLCFDKELKRSWEIHQKKLKELKCMIDFKKPPQFQFLNSRPKKEVLQQMRNFQIMRQNKVLLEKISDIAVEGDIKKFLKRATSNPSLMKKTLNEPFRKRELVKIVQENQQMLKRIQQRKSCYNTKKMEKQRQQIQKNVNLISAFPFKDFKKNKTQVNLWMTNSTYPEKSFQLSPKADNHHDKKQINLSFKKTKKFGNSYYLVISSIKNKKFIIQLENLQDLTQKYCLAMQIQDAKTFIKSYFNDSLQKMIQSLSIDENAKTCFLKYQVKNTNITKKQEELNKKVENQVVVQTIQSVKQQNTLEKNKQQELENTQQQSNVNKINDVKSEPQQNTIIGSSNTPNVQAQKCKISAEQSIDPTETFQRKIVNEIYQQLYTEILSKVQQ